MRPQYEGVGHVAQRCKKARLSLENNQTANHHDAGALQHQSKGASRWVPEQQSTPIITQNTSESKGVGPTTQHKNCTKPAAAVAIEAAADQKGVEPSTQSDPDPEPDPDPDWAIAASAAADGVSPTEDMPTLSDGNLSPGEDIGYNEDIPADATPTPTPKKPQSA